MSFDDPFSAPELTQPRPTPRDTTFAVPGYDVPEPQGFVDRVADSFGLQSSIQATHRLIEAVQPSEVGYDPLKDARFKGNEQYAPYLREARSSTEFGLMLGRYRQNEDMRRRSNANGTIWNELAAGLLDPVNYVIPGTLGAKTAGRAALEAGLLNGVSAIPIKALGVAVDPTAPKDGYLEEAFYAGVIGGVLGGVGHLGSLGEYHPAVGRLAREFADRQKFLDGDLSPVIGADGEARMPERMGRFEVRPSDGNEGFTSAYGLEKALGAGGILNPLKTSLGWAVNSGVRAYQDLALMLGGDYSAKLKDNEAGRATPRSAYLEAGQWHGAAGDALQGLFQAYSEYIGKPNPLSVAGVGVSTQAARVAGAARKLVGKKRADGKMEFNEFLEAIFDAHRATGLEPNLTRMSDASPEAVAAVHKGAKVARAFFDKADQAGTSAGFLKESYRDRVNRRFAIHDANEGEIKRLSEIANPTAIEQAELIHRTETVRPRVAGKIPEREFLQRRYDQLLGQWREGIAAGHPTSAPEMRQISQHMADLEKQGVGQRRVQPEGAVEATISNPDTTQVLSQPAANAPDPIIDEINVAFHNAGADGITGGKAANDAKPLEFSINETAGPRPLDEAVRARIDEMSIQDLEDVLDGSDVDTMSPTEHAYIEDRWNHLVRERDGSAPWHDDPAFDDGTKHFEIERNGEPVAEVRARYIEETKTVYIDWIGQLGKGAERENANLFGPRFTLDVGAELKRLFPEAEKVAGFRVSGAREATGRTGSTVVRIPERKAAVVQAIEPKDATIEGTMPRPANDDAPGANPHEGVLPHRDEAGLLPGHELIPANDNHALGGSETDPHYLPRLWDVEKIRADPDSLRARFDAWHDDQGKARLSDDAWGKILDGILEEKRGPTDETLNAAPVGGFWRNSRKLDIPNDYVPDHVERNTGELIMQYAHRFGPGLEVHQKFGERDAMDAIDAAVIQGIREGHGGKDVASLLAKAEEAAKHFQDVRDMTLGDMHKDDPLTLTRVLADNLKAYTSTVLLGKVVYSQLVELARPLMTHGFMRNFQFISDNLIGNLAGFEKVGAELRSLTSEGMDTARGTAAMRLFEFGDFGRPGSDLANRTRALTQPFMKFAHGPWYVMNLMGPITDITKNYVMVMSSHFLIEDIRRLVAGRASQRTAQNLGALGIDIDAARQMVAENIERSGRLNVANLSGWQDKELATRFAAAVRGDVNRVINTPSPQTKSAISQGFTSYGDGRRQWAMVTLPFQFMSWGLGAAQKISMSALQGRDANALGGVAALIGTAYLTQWLKSDKASWDKTPIEERVFRAVDQSGALAFAGNLNSLIEAGTMGHAGLRPLFGMDPAYGEPDEAGAVGALAGPVGSRFAEAYRAFTDPDMSGYQRASVLRRAIPTNGLVYTDGIWKGLQRGAFDLAEP